MAAFALAYNAVQNPDDGRSVIFTDESNWGGNDEGYTDPEFTRTLILTDYLGNALTTIIFPNGIYTATWPVPYATNPWVNVDYNAVEISDPSTVFDLIQKYAFKRQFELAYMAANKASCGCCPGKHPDMSQIDALLSNAEFCIPIADAPDYQSFIDSAYKLLTV